MAYKRISPQPVVEGGTGDASFTAYSVLCGGTTSTGALQNVSGVGTSGQVLTSNGAAALPTWQPGGGGSGITWVNNITTNTTMTTNTGYIITTVYAITPNVNMLLPTTSAVGDQIFIITTDTTGILGSNNYAYFTVTQNVGQYIIGGAQNNSSFVTQVGSTIGVLGNLSTLYPGVPAAQNGPPSIQLTCIVANTAWLVFGFGPTQSGTIWQWT